MCQDDVKKVLINEPDRWFTSREIKNNVSSDISLNSVQTNLRRLAKWKEITIKEINFKKYLYKIA